MYILCVLLFVLNPLTSLWWCVQQPPFKKNKKSHKAHTHTHTHKSISFQTI